MCIAVSLIRLETEDIALLLWESAVDTSWFSAVHAVFSSAMMKNFVLTQHRGSAPWLIPSMRGSTTLLNITGAYTF